jgi:hypothetical protein
MTALIIHVDPNTASLQANRQEFRAQCSARGVFLRGPITTEVAVTAPTEVVVTATHILTAAAEDGGAPDGHPSGEGRVWGRPAPCATEGRSRA